MSQIETLGLLEEIQALVSDKLQVVSYKWLSRNFSVSSDAAKRLLAKFAEEHGSGIEVVYTLSGWSKGSSPSYLVKLVPGPKLAEAKQEYDGNCSVQVYSVQACIPKDSAAIWNAEFLQAENLFMQASDVDNCLRDNRFCGILNPTVRRSIDGATVLHTNVHPKGEEVAGALSLPSNKDIKGTNVSGVRDEIMKPLADKEKVPSFTSSKQKEQSVKSSSAAGGSLANLWGRASVKSKPNDSVRNDVSADAQISAREAVEDGISDDNDQDVSYQRLSNSERSRKRIVLDMSDDDECEEAVNLASPDSPRIQPGLDAKQSSGPLLKKACLIDDSPKAKKLKETATKVKDEPRDEHKVHLQPKEDKPMVKEERTADEEINQTSTVEVSAVNGGKAPTSKVENLAPETNPDKDKVAASARSLPQRKKVLKTRIDERGREVTEVVWEGQDIEVKNTESVTKSNHDTNATASMTSRPAATKKSPALGSTNAGGGKTGNKKVQGGKGPKQGNILSYFKAK